MKGHVGEASEFVREVVIRLEIAVWVGEQVVGKHHIECALLSPAHMYVYVTQTHTNTHTQTMYVYFASLRGRLFLGLSSGRTHCVCVCVRARVCVCVCVYDVCIFADTYACMYVRGYANTHIHIQEKRYT